MQDQPRTLTKTLTTQKSSWRDKAICNGLDINTFFPDAKGINIQKYIDTKTPCNDCSVKQECIQFADDNNIEYGIWGGIYRSKDLRIHRVRNGV